MQNPIKKNRLSSIVFKKPGILFENLEVWRHSSTLEFNVFCWNFAHVFYLPVSTEGC